LARGDLVVWTTTQDDQHSAQRLERVDAALRRDDVGEVVVIGGRPYRLPGERPEQHLFTVVLGPDDYDVNELARASLGPALDHLNRQAARLGCDPLRYEVLRSYVLIDEIQPAGVPWPADAGDAPTQIERRSIVRLVGTAPSINGWTIAAVVEHTPDGNIIRAAPGETIPERYQTARAGCDHCHQPHGGSRTYLIRHAAGGDEQVGAARALPAVYVPQHAESADQAAAAGPLVDGSGEVAYQRVGASCLAGVTGHPDPTSAISFLHLVAESRGALEATRGSVRLISLETYLRFVAAVTRTHGWASVASANRRRHMIATAQRTDDLLKTALHDRTEEGRDEVDRHLGDAAARRADADRVRRVLAWARDELEPSTDLETGLKAIVGLEGIASRDYGVAATLLPRFDRQVRDQLEGGRTVRSRHVGIVDTRQTFSDLTITEITIREGYQRGQYSYRGPSRVYRFMDSAGNVLVWWAAEPIRDPVTGAEAEPGDVVTVQARVKTHEIFEGTKRTVLTRGKIKGLAPATPGPAESLDPQEFPPLAHEGPAQAHLLIRQTRRPGPIHSAAPASADEQPSPGRTEAEQTADLRHLTIIHDPDHPDDAARLTAIRQRFDELMAGRWGRIVADDDSITFTVGPPDPDQVVAALTRLADQLDPGGWQLSTSYLPTESPSSGRSGEATDRQERPLRGGRPFSLEF
jgi:hypothetical protein